MPDALTTLTTAYAARDAFRPGDTDPRRAVGYVGIGLPEDLVRAAGLKPWPLVPGYAPFSAADEYQESSAEPWIRGWLDRLLRHDYGDLRHLVVVVQGESSRRLHAYLARVAETEPGRGLPQLHAFEIVPSGGEAAAAYNRQQARALLDRLERWGGLRVDDTGFGAQRERSRRLRSLWRRVAELRHGASPRLTGRAAVAVLGARAVLEPDIYARLLADLPAGLVDGPLVTGPRCVLTGSRLDDDGLHAAVEAAGGHVVDETWEREADLDLRNMGSPLEWLSDSWLPAVLRATPHPLAARISALTTAVSDTGAALVVGATVRGDDAPRWDQPRLRDALDGAGTASLFVDGLGYREPVPDDVRRLLADRIAGLTLSDSRA